MSLTSGFTGPNTGRTDGVLFIGDPLLLGTGQVAQGEAIVFKANGGIRVDDNIVGNEVILSACTLFADNLPSGYNTTTLSTADDPAILSYAGGSQKRNATLSNGDLTLDRCFFVQRESGGSNSTRFYYVSNLYDTTMVCEGNKTLTLITEQGSKIKNLYFKNCRLYAPQGIPEYVAGLVLDATAFSYGNPGSLHTEGLNVINYPTTGIDKQAIALSGGDLLNILYIWNKGSGVDNTKYSLLRPTLAATGAGFPDGYKGNFIIEGYSASWQFVNQTDSAPVQGVKVCYYDNISNIHEYNGTLAKKAEYLTNSDGKLVGTWNSRTRAIVTSRVLDSLFLITNRTNSLGSTYAPAFSVQSYSLVPTQRQIAVKSYLHAVNPAFQQGTAFEITGKIGAVNELFAASQFQKFFLSLDEAITETEKGVVDAYTTLDTPEKLYDRSKSAWYDNESYPLLTRSGDTIDLGSYNITINASAASAYAVSGSTITIKAATFTGNLTTTGTITLAGGSSVLGNVTDSTGTRYTLPWSVTGIQPGSRLQIYNATTAQELANLSVAGTTASGTFTDSEATLGDAIRLRLSHQSGTSAKLPFESTAPATSSGVSFLAAQDADPIYNANAIDGSLITTISSDFPNVQLDISDGDGLADVREIYARFVYAITTEQGIREWFGGLRAINPVNYEVDASVLDLTIQNVGPTPVVLTGARIYRSDGQIILAASPGDQPLLQDTGELVQYIAPQIDLAITNNATITKVNANTTLIPALL
jgi:hypothetical protein